MKDERITYVKIDDDLIKEYENNPRRNEIAVEDVAKSIEKFGFKQPIVLSKDGTIVVGHTRYLAAKKLGLQKVPVIYSDLSEKDERAYRIADNRLNENAAWDFKILGKELNDLSLIDYELGNLGFTELEIDRIFLKNDESGEEEIEQGEQERYEHRDVKMVQLFFSAEQEINFMKAIENIYQKNNIDNHMELAQ